MASYSENKMFAEEILQRYPLDTAIDFIQTTMEPEDVFSDFKLSEWAIDNGFVKKEE